MTLQALRAAPLVLLLGLAPAQAAPACPFAGQRPMLVVRLYFGNGDEGQTAVSPALWQAFLAGAVTPRFPDGFTVYDAAGQWRDPKSGRIARENSRVVEIAARDTPATRKAVAQIGGLYRAKFHQLSVGLVTTIACAKF
jgi:Protein of unknown function (DUF3574)